MLIFTLSLAQAEHRIGPGIGPHYGFLGLGYSYLALPGVELHGGAGLVGFAASVRLQQPSLYCGYAQFGLAPVVGTYMPTASLVWSQAVGPWQMHAGGGVGASSLRSLSLFLELGFEHRLDYKKDKDED